VLFFQILHLLTCLVLHILLHLPISAAMNECDRNQHQETLRRQRLAPSCSILTHHLSLRLRHKIVMTRKINRLGSESVNTSNTKYSFISTYIKPFSVKIQLTSVKVSGRYSFPLIFQPLSEINIYGAFFGVV
jgi:hypothetical protein